ncbi:LOG family protein [Candidatus Daviesbacteria bacterium]|nr:LOG family protein [Candidatus Daviesbacteria bacterium]
MKIWKDFGKLLKAEKEDIKKAKSIESVAIFGYADSIESDSLYKSVVAVARKLAEAGYTVVDGGGPGVMKAATVGAKLGGGHVVGVTLYPKDMDNFEGRDKTNLFDEEIKTDNYVERTLSLMKEGQVYVVFKGGTGTISEFGMAWGLARLYFGHHKPLILYGKFWKNIIEAFKENMFLRPEDLKVYKVVDSPTGVLKAINEFEEEIKRGEHKNLVASKNKDLLRSSV